MYFNLNSDHAFQTHWCSECACQSVLFNSSVFSFTHMYLELSDSIHAGRSVLRELITSVRFFCGHWCLVTLPSLGHVWWRFSDCTHVSLCVLWD